MTNIFPQDHLFTRLLAEAEAAEAARLAEAKRKSLAAAERETQYVTKRQTVADAWQQYREEFARISAANDAVLAALQTEYDGDFELYTLEYGVIADDAETGMELTTNNVRVLHGDSDINDRWSVITQAGAVSLRKFFYPISLEGPDYYRASNSQYARPVRVMGYGTVGYVSPLSDDTRVAAYARRAAEMLLPLPAHPDAPEPLDD